MLFPLANRRSIISTLIILCAHIIYSQEIDSAYVIEVEGKKAYLDIGKEGLEIGNVFSTISNDYFVHPVTGEKIFRKDQNETYIEINELYEDYSVGIIHGSLDRVSKGIQVIRISRELLNEVLIKKIAVLNVDFQGGLDGGFLGLYIGDLLTKEMFQINTFKIIDKQLLGISTTTTVSSNDPLTLARNFGLDYMIVGTAYPPDVAEIGTEIPIQNLLGFAEDLTGKRLGERYISNIEKKQLRAIVKLSVRLIDVSSGEIIFIATEMQQAKGASAIGLEGGVLSGVELNHGVSDFMNTVTGKASEPAIKNLVSYVQLYLRGEIRTKNYTGNVVNIGGSKMSKEVEFDGQIQNVALNQVVSQGDSVYFPSMVKGKYQISKGIFDKVFNEKKILVVSKENSEILRRENEQIVNSSGWSQITSFDESLIGKAVIFFDAVFLVFRMGKIVSEEKNNKIKTEYYNQNGKLRDTSVSSKSILVPEYY